ncbi:MAG: hypothetical protein IJE65_00515 [Clostridia bacterium]|nr:hypothetical protein [Clostridia bacterium]
MKKLIIMATAACLILTFSSCSNSDRNDLVGENISNPSSYMNNENSLFTSVVSEKGYSIGVNTELFEYNLGEKDVYSAKESSAFLEITLSGGKTVDASLNEKTNELSNDGYTLTESESIAVGSEFYTARYFTAEKAGQKREYYLIPFQNECLVLVFGFGDNNDHNEALSLMIETLMID